MFTSRYKVCLSTHNAWPIYHRYVLILDQWFTNTGTLLTHYWYYRDFLLTKGWLMIGRYVSRYLTDTLLTPDWYKVTNAQPTLNWQSICDRHSAAISIDMSTDPWPPSVDTPYKTLDPSARGNWAIYWSVIVRWLRKDALFKALLLGRKQKATILVKTFGTLCFLGEENIIQVDPLPSWTVLGVTSQTPFTYLVHFMDLNFV